MSQVKRYVLDRYGTNLLRTKATIGSLVQKDYQRLPLLVDTGSSYTIVSASILTDLQYDLTHPVRYQTITTGQGNTSPLPIIRVSWFNCLGQFLENFEVVAYQLPPRLQVSGLLGMDFLTRCHAVISIAETVIYFE